MPGRRRAGPDEDGSILPLTIGYAIIALVLVLVCADATSLYLAHKRLDALADAAALAGADGFALSADAQGAHARLVGDEVRAQALGLIDEVGGTAVLVQAGTPDGASARVRVRDQWHPPVLTLFVPDGITLQAEATSRTALR